MRRLLLLAMLASLLFPFSSAVAAPVAPVLEPTISSDERGPCVNPGHVNVHTGMENSTSNISQSRSGATAQIDISNSDFDICTTGDAAGPSAWVGIQPRDGQDGTKIIQVGIIECRKTIPDTLPPVCQGENNPRFFWAYGGCAPYTPLPYDMGPADTALHTYTIWLDNAAQPTWHFQIDGAAQGTAKHRVLPDELLDCWTDGLRMAVWSFERWDTEDSIGTNPLGRSYVFNARYGVYNQGWFSPLWNNGACFWVNGDGDYCGKYDLDNFWVYNVN